MALAAGGDAGLAVDAAAVLRGGDQRDVGDGRRENLAADREDLAADAYGFGEIAGDVRQRGEKQIAEIVADEAAAGVKAILEEAAEQSFVLRERDHAVANVAGRQDAVFAAQAAGTAAVVGDGDDGGEARRSDGSRWRFRRGGGQTRSFRPRRRVERPVPPPRATTLSPRGAASTWSDVFSRRVRCDSTDDSARYERTNASRHVKLKQSAMAEHRSRCIAMACVQRVRITVNMLRIPGSPWNVVRRCDEALSRPSRLSPDRASR